MRYDMMFSFSQKHSRTTPLLVSLALVGWLAGCGSYEDSPPDSPPSVEMNAPQAGGNSDPSDPSDPQPGIDCDDPRAVDPGLRVLHSTQPWSAPKGPIGGDFAELWSTSRGYFALERGAHRPASLWRSEDGQRWSQVATSQDVSDVREVVAHGSKVYAFGADILVSTDGQHFEPRAIEGVSAPDVLAARVFNDALYLSLRNAAFSSRLVRVDAYRATTIAENLPTLAGDFILDGGRVLITEGSYQGGVYVAQLGDEGWSPAHTPSHMVDGGLDLHLTSEGYLATSSAGVWRSEDGLSFETAIHQEAPQAAVAGDELYFGTLEPWGYVAHISLDALFGERADAEVNYLDPVHVDDFLLESDGTSVVGAAMGAGLFVHEPGSESLQNVSPLRRPLQELSAASDWTWALSGGDLFYAESGAAEVGEWHHRPFEDHRFESIAALPGALFTVTRDNHFLPLFASDSGWRPGESVALGEGRVSALRVEGDEVWAGFAPVRLRGRTSSSLYGGGLFVAERLAQRPTDWSQPDVGLTDLAPRRGTPPVYAILTGAEPALVVGQGGIFLEDDGQWIPSQNDAGLEAEDLHAGHVWLVETGGAIYLATTTREGSELRRSLDGGRTWELVQSGEVLGRVSTMSGIAGALLIANERGVVSLTEAGELSHLGAASPEGTIEALMLDGSTLRAAGSYGIEELELDAF